MMSLSPRRRRKRGQTLVIFALAFLVVMGFASLAVDGSHVYLVHRQDQNAADAGALAATNLFSKVQTPISAAPVSDQDPAMKAVHDVIASNGIVTIPISTCQAHTLDTTVTPNLIRFTASWLDTATACTATTGFSWKVTVQVPPAVLVGPCITSPYNCVEVDVTDRVQNYLLGVLGTPVTQSYAAASAYAKQVIPGLNFTGIPPTAVWLYEAQGSSDKDKCESKSADQCFTRQGPPTKTLMKCGDTGCPTFWANPASGPVVIKGIDGNTAVTPSTDTLALFSNGDMLLQGATTVCDPYKAAACPGSSLGYAVTPGSNIYCSSKSGTSITPCTTVRPGATGPNLAALTGNEAGVPGPFVFPQTVTLPSVDCGTLVLNGEAITGASFPGGTQPTCLPPVSDQYTILPGKYQSIVINHGQYTFERGYYDIYGTASVNTNTSGVANGIDHSRESAATDTDLCTTGTVTGCSTLTAGVWIGRGSLSNTAFSAGNSSQCAPGQPQSGTQGGGGDQTIVDGSGISFRFESSSGGFVSTGEVQTINFSGPSPGAMAEIAGAPILFDEENPTATIHLDAVGSSSINSTTVASNFAGLIFQTRGATAGGVELDPALSGVAGAPAITGQVFAYSLTLFGGGAGTAVDFSAGYGTGTSVIVSTARREITLIGSNVNNKTPTLVDNGDGTETYTVFYGDEFAMDAYDTYFRVNGGNPLFFSKALWSPAAQPGNTLPPNGPVPVQLNPDDNSPARPQDGNSGAYTVRTPPAAYPPNSNDSAHDWTMSGTDSSIATSADRAGNYKIRDVGYWTWGHETVKITPSPNRLADTANQNAVSLTFPKQPGQTVEFQGYVTDGDRCGDFATFDQTLTQPGGPGGGSVTVPGGNSLMQ